MQNDTSSAVHAETRRLAAIMFTDMVGFSHQMGRDEARTLRLLETHNSIVRQSVAEHHGTVIKTGGDSFLIDFPSVVHAVQCAQAIQAHFHAHNTESAKADQIHVRIGLHEGDILVQSNGDVGACVGSLAQGRAKMTIRNAKERSKSGGVLVRRTLQTAGESLFGYKEDLCSSYHWRRRS